MINIGIDFVVPIINDLIGGGLPFPQNFFDTLIIDHADFLTEKNYYMMVFAPKFVV
jgi:hypothetical protein